MLLNKLYALEQQSWQRQIPIIGREKGAWLLQIIKEHQPRKILELGTANGYSGCILGSAGGKLVTVEIDEKIAREASINFSKHNIDAEIIIGNGIEIIKNLAKNRHFFDLIFIDFVKKGYLQVLEDCISVVRTRGVIIADNIGMEKCRSFVAAVLKQSRIVTKIINIGDGLSYSIKL